MHGFVILKEMSDARGLHTGSADKPDEAVRAATLHILAERLAEWVGTGRTADCDPREGGGSAHRLLRRACLYAANSGRDHRSRPRCSSGVEQGSARTVDGSKLPD